jgi:polyhydroxyalkanoate synthesis repressor PhaR
MPEPTEPGPKRLEIKKYPNRRYYDATHSRHLTLEEIRSLVQQGYDITVIDAKTGADITAQVLTQIILELETAKLDSFPVPLLVRVIRMNDQLTKDFIDKYFNQALKSFLDYQEQLEQQVRKTHGLPTSFPSVSAWTKTMLTPLSSAFGSGAEEKPAEPPAPPSAQDQTSELREMIQNLQQQVAELKKPRTKTPTKGRQRRRAS